GDKEESSEKRQNAEDKEGEGVNREKKEESKKPETTTKPTGNNNQNSRAKQEQNKASDQGEKSGEENKKSNTESNTKKDFSASDTKSKINPDSYDNERDNLRNIQEGRKVDRATQEVNKPSIELFARRVDGTGGAYQHGFTIFTDSQGQKTIITGFPEDNGIKGMLFDNLEVIDCPYTKENRHRIGKDWEAKDVKHWSIQKQELNSDADLQFKLSRAREAVKMIETGNNGGRFDYDLCFTDKCWGGNSNTVQKEIWNAMGYEIKVPKGFSLPGIDGKFYNEPWNDFKNIFREGMQKNKYK
ncbi:hypothetical protein, partial [Candidatus Jidaibacter acanthamoebae]